MASGVVGPILWLRGREPLEHLDNLQVIISAGECSGPEDEWHLSKSATLIQPIHTVTTRTLSTISRAMNQYA